MNYGRFGYEMSQAQQAATMTDSVDEAGLFVAALEQQSAVGEDLVA